MARTLNSAGSRFAASLISSGKVSDANWSFSGADGDNLLGPDGSDWANFSRYHLARNTDQPSDTKAGYSYPFGKNGNVYLAALRAIRSRASAEGDTAIFDRAGTLLSAAGGGDSSGSGKAAPLLPDQGETQYDFMRRAVVLLAKSHPDPADCAVAALRIWHSFRVADPLADNAAPESKAEPDGRRHSVRLVG